MKCTSCGRTGIDRVWRWCPDCGAQIDDDAVDLRELDGEYAVEWVVRVGARTH